MSCVSPPAAVVIGLAVVDGAMLVVGFAVVAARGHISCQYPRHSALLPCHYCGGNVMHTLCVSTPAAVVIGLAVVEGAMLVVGFAVVAARGHISCQYPRHSPLFPCHYCGGKIMHMSCQAHLPR